MSSFQTAVREWRKTRAEYGALMTGIRRDVPEAELLALADEAGVTLSEVLELCSLRRRATRPNMQLAASRFEAAQAELTEVLTQIQELEKNLALAKSRMQENELEGQLYDLQDRRQTVMLQVAETQSATSTLAAAKQAGVV